jgi:hypothetical protein
MTERNQFGPGDVGEEAYKIINSGASCKIRGCTKIADRTVDVDILGEATLFPACGNEHALKLETVLCEELSAQGRTTVPSRNGFGRS